MVSSLFADKVVYQVESSRRELGAFERVQKFNKQVEGEYLGVLDGKTYIRTNNDKLKEINCADVIVVIDNDEKPIQFDCSEDTFIPKTLTELDVKKIKKGYVGGALIAVGGAILLYNIDRTCDDCETQYDFNIFTGTTTIYLKIGYGLITIGGVLLTLGI